MNAGMLRHRIQIQAKTETRDVYGGIIETWEVESRRWASIVPLGARALFEAQQVDSRLTHIITIRHHATISTQHRILYRSRIFLVQHTRNPDERDRMTEIRCMEQIV